jgi:hypothetical protein
MILQKLSGHLLIINATLYVLVRKLAKPAKNRTQNTAQQGSWRTARHKAGENVKYSGDEQKTGDRKEVLKTGLEDDRK